MNCKPNCPCGQNPEQRPVPASAEAHGTEPSAWTDADIRRAANMSWSDAGSAETVTLTERAFARVVRKVASILGAKPQPKGTADELRAAAEQALETLELYVETYNSHWKRGMEILEPDGDAALVRLRAALAAPKEGS